VTAVLDTSAPAPIIPRQRSRRRNMVPNLLGVFVFIVATFPVYWMVLTSFRRGIDIQRPTPQFLPSPGTLANYRKVFRRDFFWTAVKNSFTVTLIVLVLALLIAFLAAVAAVTFQYILPRVCNGPEECSDCFGDRWLQPIWLWKSSIFLLASFFNSSELTSSSLYEGGKYIS